MRKYPKINKVTDFDLLECLTHDQTELDEKGIITTVFYQTSNYKLLYRYYLYKNKTIISIHDKKGYTVIDNNELNIEEIFDILMFLKHEGFISIINNLNSRLNHEIYFTGYGILGAYMQVFFKYIMDELPNNTPLYCTTFQATNIEVARLKIIDLIRKKIVNIINKFHVPDPDFQDYIRMIGREMEEAHPYFLPYTFINQTIIEDKLFDEYLKSKYNNIYINTSGFNKVLYLLGIKKRPTYEEFKIKEIPLLGQYYNKISKMIDYSEDMIKCGAKLLSSFSDILVHTKNIALVKDETFMLNKKLVKSNKIAISYQLEIKNKIPLEYFYLFLKDYNISTNNKLNIDIITSIFREYLHFMDSSTNILEDLSFEDISFDNVINKKLYKDWLVTKFSGKLSDLPNIILSNNTEPYKIHRYNKNQYCIIGSELAFDYYYKIIDYLEINPHSILKVKK